MKLLSGLVVDFFCKNLKMKNSDTEQDAAETRSQVQLKFIFFSFGIFIYGFSTCAEIYIKGKEDSNCSHLEVSEDYDFYMF
jgi:hypothetical protein